MYCSYCGGPQIFLSEELQAQLAEATRSFQERGEPAVEISAEPLESPVRTGSRWNPLTRTRPAGSQVTVQPWTLGVHYALLNAAIALALGLLSLLLPPVSLLVLLWIIGAPILAVAFFNGRNGAVPAADSGFGARLGLLTGLLVSVACASVFTLSLVLARFVFHDATTLDTQLAASFAQQRALVLARFGTEVQPTLNLFTVPEYRVGLLLSVMATSAFMYLLFSALAGALAGAVLRRKRV